MISVDSAGELSAHVGSLLGRSDWYVISGERIAQFGDLTGDRHWMHTDRGRARSEGPFGDVIAHGFFLLSLVTGLGNACYEITAASRWINYGLDRVRFTSPVVAGQAIRLALTLNAVEATQGGHRLNLGCELELQGCARPALVADWLVQVEEVAA